MSEKRILVTECNGDCRNLRFVRKDYFFDDPYIEEGFYCVADMGKVESIDPKQCENCKEKYLTGLTKAEAIERMAKAMAADDILVEGYYEMAEKGLNALLGKK